MSGVSGVSRPRRHPPPYGPPPQRSGAHNCLGMDLDVTPLFQIVAAGVAVVGDGIAWWFQPKRRARRALEHARAKRLGEVQEGDRVGVTGRARRLNKTLVSPVTGRTCLGYRFVIEERSEGWTTAVERSSCVPFGLVAEGIEATV